MAVRLDHGANDLAEVHEINVTPFIDVMLVLLIIFMVAAPLATVDVAVDLPVSTAEPQARPDKPLFLTIKEDHSLALGDEALAEGGIGSALDAASGNDKDQRIFLRADKQVDYGMLMEIMNKLRGAGHLKGALVGVGGGESRGREPPTDSIAQILPVSSDGPAACWWSSRCTRDLCSSSC